ncbi:glucose-6-phosphate exchanger SLC37A4-like isoform X2 [Scylla paramamosain]|uniref:glucose-6-phosphate exchanger SLC37A4-like isoform X2 n=1 Tax=Scylla paramamosain TaxID=85552 RepID=UPI003083C0B1
MTPDNTVSKRVTPNGTIPNGATNGSLRNTTSAQSSSNTHAMNGKISRSNGSVSSLSNGATNGVILNGEIKNGKMKENVKEMGDSSKIKANQLKSYQRAIFTALFLGYACYTYNRKSASYATPTLLAAGLVTTNTVGVISSCQNMAYAVSKFLGGVLSDKISARLLFSFGLLLSGAATLLFSRTEDPMVWAVLWAVNGFAQGCGWPSCAKLLKKWFSPANFGTWWSVLTASSNLSGTLSPFLAAYIIISHGWSASLVFAGLVSLVMAVAALLTIVDDPELANLPSPALPVDAPASSFVSAMETGGFFGGILAGVLTDRIASKVKVQANVRLLVAAAFMCACCAGLYVLSFVLTPASSQVVVSGVGAVLGASMFGPISIYGIVASESFPAHLSGTAHAFVALAANVGAVLAGWPLSRVARVWSWRGVLLLLQALTAASALLIVTTPRLHITTKAKKD